MLSDSLNAGMTTETLASVISCEMIFIEVWLIAIEKNGLI
jgi:hypothetical protein